MTIERARIRNNATGEVREYVHDFGSEMNIEADGWAFIWSDGNNACDCNRALYFARAGNEADAEGVKHPCGSVAFTVIGVWVDDELVYHGDRDADDGVTGEDD